MTHKNGWTILAAFALALALMVGLAFACEGQCYTDQWGNRICPQAPRVAPVTPPPADTTARPSAMDIRVECPGSRGSGTAVGRSPNGGTLILTNYHVIDGEQSYTVYSGDGQSANATVASLDKDNDLALLEIPQQWKYVKLGDSLDVGMAVQFRCFDSGIRFRKYYGHVYSRYGGRGDGGFFSSGSARSGNSGGGVYVDGKLVGVVWGNPQGGSAIIPVGPIRTLLGRVGVGIAAPFPEQIIEVPQPAPPKQPEAPPAQCPACDCDAKIAKLVDLQANLVEQVQKLEKSIDLKIEQRISEIKVPAGKDGKDGRDGVDGKDGKDANTAQLELRINQLEAQLAELRASTPVTWDIVPRKE